MIALAGVHNFHVKDAKGNIEVRNGAKRSFKSVSQKAQRSAGKLPDSFFPGNVGAQTLDRKHHTYQNLM
jgi:hypothetical protein